MEFTHLVYILVDDNNNNIVIKSGEFTYYDRGKFMGYNQDRSFILTCANAALARKTKSAMEAIVFDDLCDGLSYTAYEISSLYKLQDLAEVYEEYVKGIGIKKFIDMVPYRENKMDYIYHSLNFFKVYNEIIRQIDEAIDSGANFYKANKKEIHSIVYGKSAPILDTIIVPWAYNQDGNIVIDYSGLVAWKSLGLYVSHRQLVEIKYFY